MDPRDSAPLDLRALSREISHDVRGGLRVVYQFAELLERHAAAALDEEGREYLSRILSGTRRLDERLTGIVEALGGAAGSEPADPERAP